MKVVRRPNKFREMTAVYTDYNRSIRTLNCIGYEPNILTDVVSRFYPHEFNFLIFCVRKKLKTLIKKYPNFTITFPMIWRCTGNLFKILLKFKMAATNQLHNLLWPRKLKNFVRNLSNFTITFSTIRR